MGVQGVRLGSISKGKISACPYLYCGSGMVVMAGSWWEDAGIVKNRGRAWGVVGVSHV